MAALDPKNTPRFRVHYTCVGHDHTAQFRSHSSPSFMGTFYDGLMTVLDAAFCPQTIDFVDWAPTGSDIFNPVVTGIEGNIYGSSPVQNEFAAWALTFVGRTSGGRRTRLAIFGVNSLGSNYKFNAGESAVVDAGIAYIAANPGQVLGIDDLPGVWHAYADVQVNDHWVKRLR